MKISILNWINLILSALLSALSIINFTVGNIGLGIADSIIALFNLYVFLSAVARWWLHSPKVSNKFVFTCKHCGHQFIPSFWTWFFVLHIGSKRYMKCEKCKKISWMRRK